MERLLKDAQKLTGVKYNINNLADVYNAIHAIQEELGITGTTALEASETLTGSFAAMKSAFSNFMGNLSLGQDLAPSLKGLAETVSTFLFENLIPMVMNIITGLPAAIIILLTESIPLILQVLADAATAFAEWMQTGIADLINSASTIISNFIAVITESLPMILAIGQTIFFALYDGITANLPQITISILALVGSIVATILSSLPSLSKAGIEIVLSFIGGILSRLPSLGLVGLQLIGELVVAIVSGLPKALELGGEIIANIIKGIVDSAKDLYAKGKEILEKALAEIDSWKDKFFEAGANIVQSIADGIKGAIGKVTSAIKETVSEIRAHLPFSPAKKGPLKDLNKLDFGIIADGIYNAKNPVANAMRALSQEAMDGFDAAGDIQKNISYKASLDTDTKAKSVDKTNESQQFELLEELIHIVKDLKDKVEKLPDRQLMLARE